MQVVTYNIQWGKGRDGRVDLARIADTVRGADIICLQEVERHWRAMDHPDQVARLAALLPDRYHAYAPCVDLHDPTRSDPGARRGYGLVTLSRWPILSSRVFPLRKYPVIGHLVDQSCLQELVIDAEGRLLRVYHTHLNHLSSRQRQLQIRDILRIVADAPLQGGPVAGIGVADSEFQDDWIAVGRDDLPAMPQAAMIMGDFNMQPQSADYDLLVGEKDPFHGRLHEQALFSDVLTLTGHAEDWGATYPGGPGEAPMRIDHILVNGALVPHVKAAWIDDAADGSDHQPVHARIEFS